MDTRKFKINNISVSFSNYSQLSDRLEGIDILNKKVAVFWKSQSAELLSDCLLVYSANIKRYTHSEKKVNLYLEDETQTKLSKEIPLANLQTGPWCYSEKYKNRPVPIAYGHIPRAPAVILPDTATADETEEYGGF